MGAGNQQVLDKILIFHCGGGLAHTAATLGLVVTQGLRFGIAGVGNRHHPILFSDQVFHCEVVLGGGDLGATLIAVLGDNLFEFLTYHQLEPFGIAENIEEIGDFTQFLLIFV